METIKHLHFKPSNQILCVTWLILLLSGCNYPATRGPVWLGNPVVSLEIVVRPSTIKAGHLLQLMPRSFRLDCLVGLFCFLHRFAQFDRLEDLHA